MSSKKVSILMGIYNNSKTLEQAVASIQEQTYTNWELIMCDDGSVDDTYETALKLCEKDDRLILIKNETNCGLNKTLNNCLKIATGDYIARMDGDDDCLPTRFEKQVEFLNTHKDFDIVGTSTIFFDENGEWGRSTLKKEPQPYDVATNSPICHATVMLTKKSIFDVEGYTVDDKMLRVEDVNLWIKLYSKGYRCYNLQEHLYRVRNNRAAFERRKYRYRINSTYVRLIGCKMLNLGPKAYLKSFMPMIVGLVPTNLRIKIKKALFKNNISGE